MIKDHTVLTGRTSDGLYAIFVRLPGLKVFRCVGAQIATESDARDRHAALTALLSSPAVKGIVLTRAI